MDDSTVQAILRITNDCPDRIEDCKNLLKEIYDCTQNMYGINNAIRVTASPVHGESLEQLQSRIYRVRQLIQDQYVRKTYVPRNTQKFSRRNRSH